MFNSKSNKSELVNFLVSPYNLPETLQHDLKLTLCNTINQTTEGEYIYMYIYVYMCVYVSLGSLYFAHTVSSKVPFSFLPGNLSKPSHHFNIIYQTNNLQIKTKESGMIRWLSSNYWNK